MAAGAEGEALANHFVARLHAKVNERQMHGSSARTKGHHFPFAAHEGLEVVFEGVYIGTEGHNPIRVERFLDIFHFVAAHVGKAKINARVSHSVLSIHNFAKGTPFLHTAPH
jgi:hypothetical protein